MGKATCGQSQRHRKTDAAKLGEWRTASHAEQQSKTKKPEIPSPPNP
jgi:hypothetical protein